MHPRPFSGEIRDEAWRTLSEGVFDLLIIGGGLTGLGIAHDAAGRGLRVAVVDAGDVGGGTSSRSSRLVHGGLRYLETFEFGLVFEALKERRRLLELAPHLVQPLPFLFPVYRGDDPGLAKLATGMWFYDSLSLFRSPRRHRILGREGSLTAEPNLRADRLTGGAVYYDAQVDDARLSVAVARAAHQAGAVVMSYARAVGASPRRGAVGAVQIRDELGNSREVEVEAKLIVNAGGPWSDQVRRLADPSASSRLRATKGAHILLDRDRVGNRNAIIFRSVVDGRVMFLLPWGAFTYVGTTDTEFAGDPREAVADADDIRYLLDSANHLFPGVGLAESDVVSTWAGVRPLLAPGRSGVSASATSREHAIWRDRSGMLNVAGGKLTTYRSMAAEATEVAVRILKSEFRVPSGQFYTEYLRLPGAPDEIGADAAMQKLSSGSRDLGISDSTLAAMFRRYGEDTAGVLEIARGDPALLGRVAEPLDYMLAETVFAVRSELALTLEDVLRRRLHVFYELRDGGLSVLPRVVDAIAREAALDWSPEESERQIRAYTEVVGKTRALSTATG